MSSSTAIDLEQAATAYEEMLVPAVFEPWTRRVLDGAGVSEGQRVLDVACGTGVLARAAADRVGPSGSVIGLDINPGMLAVAARTAPGIIWRQGDATTLPFEAGSFDAVVSQFGLMFFPDRQAALREMMRVLLREGRLAVAVFGSLDEVPAYAALARSFERHAGAEVAEALRSPFSLGDVGEIESLFAAAGIRDVAVSSFDGIERFPSVRDTVMADVRGWFPLAGIRLDEPTLDAVVSAAEEELVPFTGPDGAVSFGVRVQLITAVKE